MTISNDLPQDTSGESDLREFGNGGINATRKGDLKNSPKRDLDRELNLNGEDTDLVNDGLEFSNDEPILANTRENDNMR